jgi:cyclophilin family peptidyl-prolyl cis-trans isomerase
MAEIKDPENTILMELKDGTVVIELLADVAPKHTERMKELARAGAYDNVVFHRVIEGFMAQTGDVEHGNFENDFNIRRAGTGGSDLPDLPAEFSKLPHDRGTLGAARSSEPELGQQPVLHQLQGQPLPERAIHGLRPRDFRDGACRRHRARRAADEPRPDAFGQGGRRCVGCFSPRCSSPAWRSRRPDGPGPNLVIEVEGEASGTVVIDLLPEDRAAAMWSRSPRSPARAPMTAWSSTA